MKKTIVLVAAALIMATALVSFAGCGGSSTSSSNSKGQTSSGDASNTSGEVTEAELGVPIYPGATKTDLENALQRPNSTPGGTPPNSGPQPNGNFQGSAGGSMTALWTKDSTDKVFAWYREQLKSKAGFTEMTPQAGGPFGQSGDGGNAGTATIFSLQSGNTMKMVMVRNSTQDNGGTIIMVGDIPQGMPSGPAINQSSNQNGV